MDQGNDLIHLSEMVEAAFSVDADTRADVIAEMEDYGALCLEKYLSASKDDAMTGCQVKRVVATWLCSQDSETVAAALELAKDRAERQLRRKTARALLITVYSEQQSQNRHRGSKIRQSTWNRNGYAL